MRTSALVFPAALLALLISAPAAAQSLPRIAPADHTILLAVTAEGDTVEVSTATELREALGLPEGRPYDRQILLDDAQVQYDHTGRFTSVQLTGPTLATYRGLRAGDPRERVFELYGGEDPGWVNLWMPFTEAGRVGDGPSRTLHVRVFGDRVRDIMINTMVP